MTIQSIGPTNTARLFTPRGRQADLAAKVANPALTIPNIYGDALNNSGTAEPIPVPGGLLFTNPYNIYVVPLDNIFYDIPYEGNGTTFWVQYATDNTVLAAVKFHSTSMPRMTLYPPLHLDGFPYKRFYLSNLSAQAGKTIQIFTSLDLNSIGSTLEVG